MDRLARLVEAFEKAEDEFPDVRGFVAFGRTECFPNGQGTPRWPKMDTFETLIRDDRQFLSLADSSRFSEPHSERLVVFAKRNADEKRILDVLHNLALRTTQESWYRHPSGYHEAHPAEINWLRWLIEELWDDAEMVEHFPVAFDAAGNSDNGFLPSEWPLTLGPYFTAEDGFKPLPNQVRIAWLKRPLFRAAADVVRKFVAADGVPATLKGVSLRDIAELLNEGERDASRATVRRWYYSRSPMLPDSLGKDPEDSRGRLLPLSAILEFVKVVESVSDADIIKLRKKLQEPPPRRSARRQDRFDHAR